MEKKDLVVQAPAEIIRLALDKGGVDFDKLEKALVLQERWEANEAKKAYHIAMAAFKSNPPEIDKDRTVSFGQTTYNHASLYNVTKKISAELSKHGLSASWSTKQTESTISVICKITHVRGHSEVTELFAPADSSGSKNVIQAIGSTITYLERYTLLALTGLATADGDNDGGSPVEKIDENQLKELTDMIDEYKIDKARFFGAYAIEKVADLPKAKYQDAYARLLAKGKK